MKIKKKIIIGCAGITIITIGLFIFLRYQEFNSYKNRGNQMIGKIYNFQKIENRLPNSTLEFSTDKEMGEGPYYEKLNDTVFVVYFNIGFDDKIIFNSLEKTWE